MSRARELIPLGLRTSLGSRATAFTRPARYVRARGWYSRGFRFGRALECPGPAGADPPQRQVGPLESYFDAHTDGPGIWKWRHYFEIYHRHLAQFRDRRPHVLEIGVYSGGSLGMWGEYFGPSCQIYGLDIEPACRAYGNDGTTIFIGDQADPALWRELIAKLPRLDVVIDDGGHLTQQQVTTFEMVIGALSPGGVYICEDIHGAVNGFHEYMCGLSRNINAWDGPTDFQRMIHSIHMYPFMTVVERRETQLTELTAPRHGTQWQPFL